MSGKYSLKSFVLFWALVFIFSSLAFVYIILNLFFSEHLTSSSLKDLRYTSHVVKLKLGEEKELMNNTIALHVASQGFRKSLHESNFKNLNLLLKNWKAIHKIDEIQVYNSEGKQIDPATGEVLNSGLNLSPSRIQQLASGYASSDYLADAQHLTVMTQRKILSEEGLGLGYLVEQKKIRYEDFLSAPGVMKNLIVQNKNKLAYVSSHIPKLRNVKTQNLKTPALAFELHLGDESFDVLRADISNQIVFFFVAENLKTKVFTKFYKKYFLYFLAFLLFTLLIFYTSYYLQVFKPLRELSQFVSEGGKVAPQIESSVAEISVISKGLSQRIKDFENDSQEHREGRAKDMARLVASVAHELNNSLSYLGGNIDYLEEELAQEVQDIDLNETQDAVSSIRSAYARIKKIVSDLKVFSSKRELKIEWIKATQVVDKIKKEFGASGFHADLDFKDLEVETDEDRILQIIRNLVLNSKQAYPQGDGRVEISLYQTPDAVVFKVKDWAGGIPQEVVKKIFEPFYTTKKNKGGAGLGLSLSQTLAKEVGADLSLQDTSSEGTSFCINLRHFRS